MQLWGAQEDPEAPPHPPPRPTYGVQPSRQPCSYLLASRVTSARSRRMEQLNSSSRVKDTWGKAELSARWDGCTGSRGVSQGESQSPTLASERKTG